jgi:DoxX-like family
MPPPRPHDPPGYFVRPAGANGFDFNECEHTIFYVIITIIAAAANAGIAVATLARAPFVVANFGDIEVRPSWLPGLAILQLAGAVGLVVGLFGPPIVGLAAAIGLVLFFLGAVVTHLRSRAYKSLPSPAFFLALAIATLVGAVLR